MILKHLRRQELGFSYLWQDVSIFQSLSPSENPQLRIFMFLIPPRNLAAAFLHLLKDLRIFMCGFRSRILFIGLYAVWTTVVVPKSGTHLAASACALHSQVHEVWRGHVSQDEMRPKRRYGVLAFFVSRR